MTTNDTAIILGASGGLGLKVVELLKKRGLKYIIGTYRNNLPAKIHYAEWVRFDAASPHKGLRDLHSKLKSCKPGRINFLHLIGEPSSKLNVVDTGQDEFVRLFISNVMSFTEAYKVLRDELRHSKARVIVVSSDTTRSKGIGNGAYSASKAALEMTALTLAKEEAPFGVRVNVFAPTLFESPLARKIIGRKGIKDIDAYFENLPWGRPISINEAASAAVSLLYDDAWDYAAGQIFRLAVEVS
jgi:NAD(P)-dependent dehydrogenase (short-subunit alcohol dehydrogenase family)